MSYPIIFNELPETFPEKDQYERSSLVTSLMIHALLVAALLAIPFLFLEEIPQFRLFTMLAAPPPPPGAPITPVQLTGAAKQPAPRPMTPPKADSTLIVPTVVPQEIARIIDASEPVEGVIWGVPGGVPGGVAGGMAGGVVGSLLARNAIEAELLPLLPPPPPPEPKAASLQQPYRVGGDVKEPRLTKLVPPKYPPLASRARVHGKVVLEATLTKDGTVDAIRVVSGHPLLIDASIECVKQWRYEPTLLNGQPVAIILTAIVTFNQAPPLD